jgi:hypothetical protein
MLSFAGTRDKGRNKSYKAGLLSRDFWSLKWSLRIKHKLNI